MGWIRQILGIEDDAKVIPGADVDSGKPSDSLAGFSNDEIQTAALRVFTERPSSHESWIGGTVEECDRALADCARLRGKYADYQPPRMRRAIMDWIDYFECQARSDRRDCETQKSRKDQEAYRAQCKAEQERTHQILDRLRNA